MEYYEVNMQSLALIVLFVAAASAFPTDKYFYKCIPYLSDHSIVYKEKTFLCDSFDGRRYLVAKDNDINDWDIDDFALINNVRHIPLVGGLGGAGSASGAQSSAGSLGGTIGGGLLPFSLSGSVSGSQSTAGSVAGGGGLGFLG